MIKMKKKRNFSSGVKQCFKGMGEERKREKEREGGRKGRKRRIIPIRAYATRGQLIIIKFEFNFDS